MFAKHFCQTRNRFKTKDGFRICVGSIEFFSTTSSSSCSSRSSIVASLPSRSFYLKNELLLIRHYSNYLHKHNLRLTSSSTIHNIRCLNNNMQTFNLRNISSSSSSSSLSNLVNISVITKRFLSNTRPHNLFNSEFSKSIDNNNNNSGGNIEDRFLRGSAAAGLVHKSYISKADQTISWNDTVKYGRKIANYNLDLYQKLFKDPKLKEQIDLDYMLTNEHFHQFLRYYLKTYNHQITGLITILFTKLFLYSSQLLPELLTEQSSNTLKKDSQILICNNTSSSVVSLNDLNERSKLLENELGVVAECYDLLSYGFFFHEMISNLGEKTNSFRNLLLLLGDYFLIKSSYDIVGFSRIDLYKIHVAAFGKFIEGEGMTFTPDDDKAQVGSNQSTNNFTDENESIERLVEYCFLTNGQLVASSLQATFYMANFSHKAQMLAYEFGKNIGIALKISNQLSTVFQARFDKMDPKTADFSPCTSSFFKKFPSVSVETMQLLINQYANRSIELLQLLCNIGNVNETVVSSSSVKIPENSPLNQMLNKNYTSNDNDYGKLSEQSILLLKALVQIINEITHFNDHYFVQHNNQQQQQSTNKN